MAQQDQSSKDDGGGYLERLLEDSLSGAGRNVEITGFSGALSSTASLETLTIADRAGVWITLRQVELEWTRSALLSGQLDIEKLTAAVIDVPRPPKSEASALSPEATPFSLPELPVSVNIGEISTAKLILGKPVLGKPVTVQFKGSAYLAGGAGKTAFELKRVDGRRGAIKVAGSYANSTQALSLLFDLSEDPNGITAHLLGLPGEPSVDMKINGTGTLSNFLADLSLGTNGAQRLSGRLTLTGEDKIEAETPPQAQEGLSLSRLFALELGGDLRPLFSPDYRRFFGDSSRLVLKGAQPGDGRLTLDALELTTEAMIVTGSVGLDPDGWPERVDLKARVLSNQGDAVVLPLAGEKTRLGRADLMVSYDRAVSDQWVADLVVKNLSQDQNALETLRAEGAGTLKAGCGEMPAQIQGKFNLAASGLALADPALAEAAGEVLSGKIAFDYAQGSPLLLSEIAVAGADFGVTGQAKLQRPEGQIDLIIHGAANVFAQDGSRFSTLAGIPLAGALQLEAVGTGAAPTGSFDFDLKGKGTGLQVGDPRADALLEGESTIALSAKRDETGTQIRAFNLSSDHASARMSGMLETDGTDLSFAARLADASRVIPNLQGSFDVTGRAVQNGQDWALDLRADGPESASLALDGQVTLGLDGPDRVSGKIALDVAKLEGYAALAQRSLAGKINLKAEGQADLASGAMAVIADVTGSDLAVGMAEVDRLLRGESRVWANVSRSGAGVWSVARLDAHTPELDVIVRNNDTGQAGQLTAKASLRDVGLLVPGLNGPASFKGHFVPDNGDWQVSGEASGPAGAQAEITGNIDQDGQGHALSIHGSAPLALVNPFVKPQSLGGSIGFDLAVNGPLALSSLSGVIDTKSAQLTIPGQRLSLSPIAANVRLSAGQANVNMQATLSTGGQLTVTGPVSLGAPFRGNLQAQLSRVVLSDPNLFKAQLDGIMRMSGDLAAAPAISGQINISQLDLQMPDGALGASGQLANLRHVDEPSEVRRTRARAGFIQKTGPSSSIAIPLDLLINAPARIFVRGRGLDAELGGQMQISGTSENVIPQGQFDLIRGRLDILGKRLQLTKGYVTLQGSLDPYVYLSAETVAEETTVWITVEGNASEPEVSFTSSPELPADEILSLLIFGRNITEISAFQAIQLASAVRTLAGYGGRGIVDRLRSAFGFDDLEVSVGTDGTAGARAGKYITENIYSDVTVKTDGSSEVNLNLTISPSLTARGGMSSDGNSGIGLYFQKDY